MRSIAPDYLDRLGIAPNIKEEELEKILIAQEARCQVLLKIPVKRAEANSRLELIQLVRNLINAASVSEQPFELPSELEQDNLFTPPPKNKSSYQLPKEPIYTTRKITDEGEIGKLRSILNQWAIGIPYHEYLTFGSDINILEVEEHPIYLIEIKYLLETREIISREKPYLGEALPVNAPLSKTQVGVWEVKTPNPIGFESSKAEKEIAASRQKLTCSSCDGQGEMWCTACRSTGQVACSQCSGKYQFTCPSCDGKGQIEENKKIFDCKQCRGIGVAVCGYCREGLAQCGNCKGYRRISCKPCNSKGELLNYLALIADYKPQSINSTVFPLDFPDYIRKQISFEQEKTVVFHQEGERFVNAKPINDIKHLDLSKKILELVEQRLITEFNNKDTVKVNKHLIEVRNCPSICLKYSFEEKEYELWIVGLNNQIYSKTSPISEYDKKLSQLAKEQLSNNNFLNSIELLSDAFRHTSNSASALVVVNECVKKLQDLLKVKNYYQVIRIAGQAEKFLGDKLAINFVNLGRQAALNMRFEYIGASLTTGLLIIITTYIIMGINGNFYARASMLQTSIALIILAAGFAWFFATQLASQLARILLASIISIALVIGSSVFGLIEQDSYLSRRKEEINLRFGQDNYQASKAAIEPLEELLANFPKDSQVRLMLGRAYIKATYYEKAIQCLTLAIAINNKDAEIHNELGLAFLGKGDKPNAIKHFSQAINLRLPDRYREAYQNLARSLDMGYIEGATFGMGRSDGTSLDSPPHNVTVEPFFIDRFEITNSEYLEFVKATNHIAPTTWQNNQPLPGMEKMPVVGVNLVDARAFAAWRTEKKGFPYRLPNEAEWELAARGVKGKNFPWGNDWNNTLANVRGKEGRLNAVGGFPRGASPEGIEDLIGNAAEWIDETLKVYPGSRAIITSELWVVRGGAYDSLPTQAHGATRSGLPINGGDYHNIGFRCVIAVDKLKFK
ncbi:MAG: SUMF1/EgtB/PvdO family nonheme iron enzyme [Acidobacteria bacterium]|nr:SUMF1/EgtB/PvdO family nonheme iron enzyme [Acidobacteriota bacterium]